MKNVLRFGTTLLLTAVLALSFISHVRADTFNQNNIIDDAVFDNANSMSAAQIDNWLNSNFGSTSCISTSHGFGAPDPTGYSASTGQFSYSGNVSAGQVIYDASQAYGINPQVLLATLQKEQSLVTGSSGCTVVGDTGAMGYGCPDSGTTHSYPAEGALAAPLFYLNGTPITSVSGTCVNTAAKAGFSQQVIHAAWLLKFGEQRSEGNINWAVIKGNWDNSDDPQTCYGGPMTQGTYQRCPSGASAYYDGYTTIDSTAVHMDDGATAALYWYTPHFSGNQHFFSIFTGWFGSTHYAQPLGGSLYAQTSTGKIFLVTDSTRYYISSWNVMTDYGLDAYQPIPASDTTIQQFTDGGNLTNLVWDGNGVYLVNNRTRYHVSSAMCTAWGFSCYDNTVVKGLGAAFQTQYLRDGWDLAQLQASGGVVYEMSGGQKLPVANPQTLSDLGLANTSVLVTSALNSGQPLGQLLITTPLVLSFPPSSTVYYYNGSAYFGIPSMSIYNDWALGKLPQLLPPTSSYNTTPPSSQILSSWYQDGSGNKYIIDQGRRVQIPTGIQSLWSTETFAGQPQTLANSLPQTTLQQYIWANPGIYMLNSGGKHYVPTWNDYLALDITNDTTTNLLPDKLTGIPQGNDDLGDGIVIALQSDNQGLYVINNGKTTHIPDANTFNDFGFSWNDILTYPSTILNDYPLASSSLSSSIVNSNYYIVGTGSMYWLTPSLAADFGAIGSHFQDSSIQTVKNSRAGVLSRFMYNTNTGRIYYASGGAIHYVATYSAFVAYGGTRTSISVVNNAAIGLFTEAQPVY